MSKGKNARKKAHRAMSSPEAYAKRIDTLARQASQRRQAGWGRIANNHERWHEENQRTLVSVRVRVVKAIWTRVGLRLSANLAENQLTKLVSVHHAPSGQIIYLAIPWDAIASYSVNAAKLCYRGNGGVFVARENWGKFTDFIPEFAMLLQEHNIAPLARGYATESEFKGKI